VKVAVGVEVEIGVGVFSGVGDTEMVISASGVSLGGTLVGVAEGRSSTGSTISLVAVAGARRGTSVKIGVRIVMVESMGGKVGIAPQEDSSTVMNRSIRSFRIDFIIISFL